MTALEAGCISTRCGVLYRPGINSIGNVVSEIKRLGAVLPSIHSRTKVNVVYTSGGAGGRTAKVQKLIDNFCKTEGVMEEYFP